MMLLFMKEATIAVLPATYQSERDDTKDYAFLSLNSNIGNTLGYGLHLFQLETQWL